MTIDCEPSELDLVPFDAAAPHYVLIWNQSGHFVAAVPAPYEGPQLVGHVGCGSLVYHEAERVDLSEPTGPIAFGLTGALAFGLLALLARSRLARFA